MLSGSNALASGETLVDRGTLTVSGSLFNSGTFLVSGREDILAGGVVNAAMVVSGGVEVMSSGGRPLPQASLLWRG